MIPIDRENFRHLTGFGRDMANYVRDVFEDMSGRYVADCMSKDSSSLAEFEGILFGDLDFDSLDRGQVIIHHNQKTNMLSCDFALSSGDSDNEKRHHSASGMLLSIIVHDGDGSREISSIPVQMLQSDGGKLYHVYQHMLASNEPGDRIPIGRYTGVTKRGWRARWQQHVTAANAGSNCLFHRTIRNFQQDVKTKLMFHDIVACVNSEQTAMDIEEYFIDRDSLYPNGLNMIPGGNAGLAYLRKIGALGAKEHVGVDDRELIINRFFDRTSRKGLPNPLAAANWLNSDYAEKVICSGPDRLKPQQIRDARFFSSLGQDAETVAVRVGARNVEQIERMLSGRTYSRVA